MTMQRQPEEFDAAEQMVADHLSAVLEPQRGKAAAAFRRHLALEKEGSGPAAIPIARGRVGAGEGKHGTFGSKEIPRRALWYWAGVPSLVAAGLAVVVTLQFMGGVGAVKPAGRGAAGAGGASGAVAVNQPVRRVEEVSQEVPGEVKVLADGTPVREIRRQTVRQTQWEDAKDHATYSVTEQPMEKVDYVRVQPF